MRVEQRSLRKRAFTIGVGIGFVLTAGTASAQTDAEVIDEGPSEGEVADAPTDPQAAPSTEDDANPETEAPPAAPTADASNDDAEGQLPTRAELAEKLERLEKTVAALEAAREADEIEALSSDEVDEPVDEPFRLYGFMDMGLQRMWVQDDSPIGGLFATNATTFAVGNIDLYFDFNPHPDWRGLAEVRFTGAPHGTIETLGTPTTPFERTTTQQFDPNASALNAQMWGGYTVIERAWIEWSRYQSLQIRTGSFFTPFGIWNVDHGSPTLIATAMPQFIQMMYFPLRQVGVQALGSVFAGNWELAYRAWLSNGRQELANLDFTDDKAFGARFFARNEGTGPKLTAGVSYHRGRVADQSVDVNPTPDGILIQKSETWAYVENIIGTDISLDIGRTRIRAEGAAQLRQYEEGLRPAAGFFTPPGEVAPDSWRFAVYGLIAHELPFWGLEPYMYSELIQQTWDFPDGMVVVGPGLNIRFTPSVQLKFQGTHAMFFDWVEEYEGEIASNNVSTFVSRLVLAF